MLSPGDRVDRYTLVAPIGEGGQGAVWSVVDPLDPTALRALKFVALSAARDIDLERVRREARTLASLRHPSLVQSHALFEDLPRGLLGFVVDLVPGHSLAHSIDDPRLRGPHGAAICTHVARVLAFLHRSGLVHRDVKPENVVVADAFWTNLDDATTVKLIDFGIATDSTNSGALTQQGLVIGTRPYLAPELIDPGRWRASAAPTSRDVFAFGVLAWRLLSGAMPASEADGDVVTLAAYYATAAAGRAPWPARGTIDGPWASLVKTCLSIDPAQRPTSMIDVERALSGGTATMTAFVAPQVTLPMPFEVHAHQPVVRTELMNGRAVGGGGITEPTRRRTSGRAPVVAATVAILFAVVGAAAFFAREPPLSATKGAIERSEEGVDDVAASNEGGGSTKPKHRSRPTPPADEPAPPSEKPPRRCSEDLTSDAANCGRCGHDCLGGACVASQCQAVAVATSQEFPRGLVLEYDEGPIVWTTSSSGSMPGAIRRAPLKARAAWTELYRGGSPLSVTQDREHTFYWTDPQNASIFAGKEDGSRAWSVLAARPGATRIMAFGADRLVWTDRVAGSLNELRPSTGVSTQLVNDAVGATRLSTDGGSRIAWTSHDSGAVGVYDALTHRARWIATSQPAPLGIAWWDGHFYWACEHDGTIRRDKGASGGAGGDVVTTSGGGAAGLTIDADGIFWTDDVRGEVLWKPWDGAVERLATGQAKPLVLLKSSTRVIWINSGTAGANDGSVMFVAR